MFSSRYFLCKNNNNSLLMEQSSTGVPLLPQKQYWSVAPHRLHYTPSRNWLMTWNQALGNQWSYMIPYITHRYPRLMRNLPPIPLVLELSTQLPIETAPGERVVGTNDGHRPPFFLERKKKYILSGCKKICLSSRLTARKTILASK